MKSATRYILVSAMASLLIACDANQGTDKAPAATEKPATVATAPAPVVEQSGQPFPGPGKLELDVAPGNIVVRANQVGELEILESLAAAANFELLTGEIAWKTVTVDIREDSLHAVLTALIKAYPYQLVYTPDKDTQQEMLSAVVISAMLPPATPASPTETAREDRALPDEEDDLPDPEIQAGLKDLQSPSAEVRAKAVAEVEPVGEAFNTLTDLIVNDPSPEVRIAVSEALEFSEDPLAIEALVACLKDENIPVVLECITALEHIGDSSTAARLQPLLEHHDVEVSNAAARAIENLQ